MRPLHPIDFIFLSLEKRQQPMHVGGLFLFEIPENASPTFVHDLVQDIRQSKSIPVPPFNNQLNGLFWGEDEEFDIDHHFRHIALPNPGRILNCWSISRSNIAHCLIVQNHFGPAM